MTHPRTYSLTASGPNGELFLVTDDESGINIGHAKLIGGPLTARAAAPERAPSGSARSLLRAAQHAIKTGDLHGLKEQVRSMEGSPLWEVAPEQAALDVERLARALLKIGLVPVRRGVGKDRLEGQATIARGYASAIAAAYQQAGQE